MTTRLKCEPRRGNGAAFAVHRGAAICDEYRHTFPTCQQSISCNGAHDLRRLVAPLILKSAMLADRATDSTTRRKHRLIFRALAQLVAALVRQEAER